MTICKQLVEMMGGSIGVDSEVGKGSEFFIRFKLPYKEEIQPHMDINLHNVPVLVVDDGDLNRRIALEYLRSLEIPCDEAAGAAEAMEKLKQAKQSGTPFGIAVLDYFMGETDGGNLAEMIKSDALVRDTVLVLLSSSIRTSELDLKVQEHFSAILVKPIRVFPFLQALSASWRGFNNGSPPDRPDEFGKPEKWETLQIGADILLVEDNPINKKVALGILRRYGCAVDNAENGKEALGYFKRKKYAAIFMDVHMPVMDGFEATRQIRKIEAFRRQSRTPVIAMTALAMEGDRERCQVSGMDDYISKPVKSRAILDILTKYCSEYHMETKGNSTYSDAIHQNHAPPVLNPSQLLDITDHDEELILELVGEFAKEAPILLNALQTAIESGNQDRIMKTAHRLNGVVANCGGERLLEASLKIEKAARQNEFNPQIADIPFLKRELDHLKQALGETDWKTACKTLNG